jgi:ABC-type transporter Mla subunit MlaD
MATQLDDLSKEVSALRADMAQINTLVDRLDITIEKLTEVSTNVSQLLAVQGSRLDQQERSSSQLSLLIEKRKDEVTESVENLYKHIESTEKNFKTELEKVNEKIFDEIKAIREESRTQHASLNKKISELEKWMWIVTGGAAVVGFLISKFVNIGKFFG